MTLFLDFVLAVVAAALLRAFFGLTMVLLGVVFMWPAVAIGFILRLAVWGWWMLLDGYISIERRARLDEIAMRPAGVVTNFVDYWGRQL